MSARRPLVTLGAIALAGAAMAPALAAGSAPVASPAGVDLSCLSPDDSHVDPKPNAGGAPTNPAWYARDAHNQYCATLRIRDQLANPAFGYGSATQGDGLWLEQLGQQVSDGPRHVHGGVTTVVPGSQAADAMRTISRWEQRTGGRVVPVAFRSSDGAQLRGHIWLPPAGTPPLANGHYPGLVITDGSVQGYENLYYWAAEGLAQYGYEVMTYDVQGQGDSDAFPDGCPGPAHPTLDCQGVPYQQNYNFYQGAEDSLGLFLATPAHPYHGTYNPAWSALDHGAVGIAGHSLGASAVSWAGQCDARVKAIVAWDDLVPVDVAKCPANVAVARAHRARALHAPALAMTNDYEFNPQPMTSVPNPDGAPNAGGLDGTAGYLDLTRHGVDSEVVSIRNGTHLTYSYVPYVLPANQVGERVAFYYTLAWFDEYLRGGADPLLPANDSAFTRLTNLGRYDRSADRNVNRANPKAALVAFGAGTYSPAQAATNPLDPTAGNVAYRIEGLSIRDTLSFYFYSEYRLHEPASGSIAACTDMLAGCPKHQPPTP